MKEDVSTPVAPSPLPVRPAPLEALIAAHLPFAHRIADRYFIPGGDRDDVRQEAAIALLEAAEAFDGTGTFAPFAGMVIHRRLFDQIKHQRRDFRRAQLEAIRGGDIGAATLARLVDHRTVHDQAVTHLELERVRRAARTLTDLERSSLAASLDGDRYYESKAADNAAQRARRKLRRAA